MKKKFWFLALLLVILGLTSCVGNDNPAESSSSTQEVSNTSSTSTGKPSSSATSTPTSTPTSAPTSIPSTSAPTSTPSTSVPTSTPSTSAPTSTPSTSVHEHNYSSEFSFNASVHWVECSCGEKNNIGEHTYGEWIIIEVATHEKDGSKKQICSVCGYENVVKVPLLGHDLQHHEAKDPTCTEVGWDEYYTCSSCDYSTYQEIPALGHSYGNLVPAVPATCESEGTVAHHHCSECDKYFNENKEEITTIVVPALGHSYGNLVSAVPATCENEGTVAHYHCSSCDKYFNENKEEITTIAVPALGHSYGDLVPGVPATCESEGTVAYYHCSVCDKYFNENKEEITTIVAPALGHSYGNLVSAVPATCENEGTVAHYHCSECDKYFNENKEEITTIVVPALGHSYNSNGICETCSSYQPAYYNETEGYYEISNIGQFNWFAQYVNSGNNAVNAILTNDIDFGNSNFIQISKSSSNKYNGTFDGQGHTITVNQSATSSVALFGHVSNCTIKNLNVTGKIVTSTKYAAGIASVNESGSTTYIENCYSSIIIESTINGDGTHAGIIGMANGNVYITNCAFVGEIKGANTTSCAGIVGWTQGKAIITNSFVAATVENTSSSDTFSRNNSKLTLSNCYYLNSFGSELSTAIKATEEKLSSGEIAYILSQYTNGSIWGQKLGENGNSYPILRYNNETESIVYKNPKYTGCEANYPEELTYTYSNSVDTPIYVEHTCGDLVVGEAATCTHEGTASYYYCSSCDKYLDVNKEELETLVIPKLPHDYSLDWSNDESNHWHECSCGDKSEVSAHTYGEFIITTPGTETVTGSKKHICSVCDYEEVIDIIPYTITFVANDGIHSNTATFYNSEILVEFTAASKEHYTFLGWYLEETFETLVTSTEGLNENITLYAKFEATSYTITYMVYGGDNPNTETSYDYFTLVEFDDASRNGSTFAGWYLEDTFETLVTSTSGYEQNITLYAKWINFTYTIAYEANGGVDTNSVTSYDVDTKVIFEDATKDYYDFVGWYLEETFETLVTSTEGLYSNITLYAKWTPTKYVINYEDTIDENPNASEFSIETIVEFVPAIRYGYTFVGWYSDTTLENTITSTEGIYENISVYAKWQINTYTISYEANGGVHTNTATSYDAENKVDFTAATKENYNFLGWYLEETFETLVTSTEGVYDNITLYAKYKGYEFDVALDANGGIFNDIHKITYMSNGSVYCEKSYGINDLIEYIIPVREGYAFSGWYLDEEYTQELDWTENLSTDVILYAKWIKHSGDGVFYIGSTSDTIIGTSRNDSNKLYFAFVPLVSGVIKIYSKSSGDTYGYLCDSDKKTITFNDDNLSSRNFYISYPVTAGKLYYISPCGYSGNVEMTVTIEGTAHPIVSAKGANITSNTIYKAEYGQIPTLNNVIRDGYEFLGWYKEDDTLFDDSEVWTLLNGISLTAKWSLETYTISYEANGGIHSNTTTSYDINNNVTFTDATKEGYTFIGWYLEDTFDTLVTSTEGIYDNITLYAKFELTVYTVTYEENLTTNPNASEFSIESVITFEAPTRNGYTFVGWYSDATLETEIISTEGIYENISVYAKWQINTYTISYVANGGIHSNTTTSYDINNNVTFTDATKEGYTFIGWYLEDTFETLVTSTEGIYENITLYAKFEAHEFNVTLDANGGTFNDIKNKITYISNNEVYYEHEYGKEDVIEYIVPRKEGYVFAGWYLDEEYTQVFDWNSDLTHDVIIYAKWFEYSGNGVLYTGETSDTIVGTSKDGANKLYFAYVPLVSETIKIYSNSLGDTYGYLCDSDKKTIAFNDDNLSNRNFLITYTVTAGTLYYISPCGFSGNVEMTVTIEGTAFPIPSGKGAIVTDKLDYVVAYDEIGSFDIATRVGYEFIGWYTSSDEYVDTTVAWNIQNDVELFAKWQINTYTITYEADGGVHTNTTTSYDINNNVTFIDATKEGYTFLGWYLEDTFDILVTSTEGIYENITLYAKFEANKYNVTLDANGGLFTDVKNKITYICNNEVYYEHEYAKEDVIEYIVPRIDGYAFAGWYLDEEYTQVFNWTENLSNDVVLFAKMIEHSGNGVLYTGETSDTIVGTSMNDANRLYFAYVPLVSETIKIYSNSSGDTYGYLWDSNKSLLKGVDHGGANHNFLITYSVTAGTLYYISPCGYSGNVEMTVTIEGTAKPEVTANGATISAEITKKVIYDNVPEFNIPHKLGYEFLGWYTSGDEYVDTTVAWNIQNDVELFAKWQVITYTIAYEANGGTHSNTATSYDVENKVDFTAATKENYNFLGWYLEDTFDTLVTSTEGLYENITLYAKYKGYEFDVALDANGGLIKDIINKVTYMSNGSVYCEKSYGINDLIEYIIPVREGYAFAGWYLDEEYTQELDWTENLSTDVILYAKWIEHSGNGVFYTGETSDTFVGTLTNDSNRLYFAFLPLVSGTIKIYSNSLGDTYGYLCDSDKKIIAYDDDSGSNRNFFISYTVTAGTLYYISPCGYSVNVEMTVTIEGTAKPEVTAKGAIITSNTIYKAEYGQIPTLNTVTRDGYEFLGWYKDDDTLFDDSEVWTLLNGISLTAKWQVITYTISYEANGGIHSNTATSYDVENKVDFTSATKDYYDFVGWYLEETFETLVTSTEGVYGNITLYAKFTPTVYTVTYEENLTTNPNASEFSIESVITFEAPTRNGYTFVGWYSDATLETEIISTEGIYENISVYAKWDLANYTIIYEANGGVHSNTATSYDAENKVDFTSATKDYYDFVGWYLEETFETLVTSTEGVYGNITLYAKFTPTVYTVTLDANGGKVGTITDIWDGSIASSFENGTGSETDPYIIKTGAQLAYLASTVNSGTTYKGCYFILENNIDLNNINWTSIGKTNFDATSTNTSNSNYFAGIFDGKGHIISNLTQTTVINGVTGLFGAVISATISNLVIESANINLVNTSKYTDGGILIGLARDVIVSQCSISGSLSITQNGSSASYIGGAIGVVNSGSITNLSSSVDITVSSSQHIYVGGIIGRAQDNITISMNLFNGSISIRKGLYNVYAGGIIGITEGVSSSTSSINNCVTIGTFTGNVTRTPYMDAVYNPWSSSTVKVNSCYYNATFTYNSSTLSSKNGTSTSLSNLNSKNWYITILGWDLTNVWQMSETYPMLKGIKYSEADSQLVQISYNQSFELSIPKKAGYIFLGWYDGVAGTGNQYTDETGTSIKVWDKTEEVIVLYAKWDLANYTITYEANGGIHSNTATSYDAENKVDFTSATKDYYDFVGWYLEETFETLVTSTEGVYDNITLYAKFTPTVYTVTYEENLTTNPNSSEFSIESVITFEAPTRNGYTFVGWYSDATLETEIISTEGIYENISVYAKWDLTNYTITYEVDGGDNPNTTASYDVENKVDFASATKEGYTFLGWYLEDTFETLVTSTEGLYQNITLYAKWEIIE